MLRIIFSPQSATSVDRRFASLEERKKPSRTCNFCFFVDELGLSLSPNTQHMSAARRNLRTQLTGWNPSSKRRRKRTSTLGAGSGGRGGGAGQPSRAHWAGGTAARRAGSRAVWLPVRPHRHQRVVHVSSRSWNEWTCKLLWSQDLWRILRASSIVVRGLLVTKWPLQLQKKLKTGQRKQHHATRKYSEQKKHHWANSRWCDRRCSVLGGFAVFCALEIFRFKTISVYFWKDGKQTSQVNAWVLFLSSPRNISGIRTLQMFLPWAFLSQPTNRFSNSFQKETVLLFAAFCFKNHQSTQKNFKIFSLVRFSHRTFVSVFVIFIAFFTIFPFVFLWGFFPRNWVRKVSCAVCPRKKIPDSRLVEPCSPHAVHNSCRCNMRSHARSQRYQLLSCENKAKHLLFTPFAANCWCEYKRAFHLLCSGHITLAEQQEKSDTFWTNKK